MSIGTRLFTQFKGEKVGEDQFGNRYFQEKKAVANRRRRRWVLFKGKREASKIPAEWHAWLHYTVDAPLSGRYAWQLEHTPNLTGTRGAYVPSGDDRAEGVRAKGTGDYEAWSPAE